ncbi:39S ribosomal protein L40, mitochondrial-like [Gigantopelta aegis]|uniref:39S ribosomal protein L40, mitochondrial-like n=1 Tax=Gigantopelta aegis TaxID=1735272 RepID=UPI001B88CF30|nr:39S ribosomal protein L40, mitochondrial-like [Gigantopelta aegis]
MAAPMLSKLQVVCNQFLRLSLASSVKPVQCRCLHTQRSALLFRATAPLGAEPMKKKRRLDPTLALHREQKKRKRIEKQIKRLEKQGRQLKPVMEIEGDPRLRAETQLRKRETSALLFEEGEARIALHKSWCNYKLKQHIHELTIIKLATEDQQRALTELRNESEDLYQQAIQMDEGLIPVVLHGPVHTPPIGDYEPPDGDYINTTKTFK